MAKARQTILPPQGRGRGEGEARLETPIRLRPRTLRPSTGPALDVIAIPGSPSRSSWVCKVRLGISVGCVSFPLTLALRAATIFRMGREHCIPRGDESRRSELAKARRTILPLLGERAGVRAASTQREKLLLSPSLSSIRWKRGSRCGSAAPARERGARPSRSHRSASRRPLGPHTRPCPVCVTSVAKKSRLVTCGYYFLSPPSPKKEIRTNSLTPRC